MKKLIMMLLLSFLYVKAQDSTMLNIKPWEKLGTTSKEWHEAQLRGFSDDSIKIVISYGINLSDYFKQPWVALSITCSQWLDYRKQGLIDEDIKHKLQPDTVISKVTISFKTEQNDRSKIKALFIPGLLQIQNQRNYQKAQGIIMSSLALIGLSSSIVWSIQSDAFQCVPFISITLPIMFWSYFNAKNMICSTPKGTL